MSGTKVKKSMTLLLASLLCVLPLTGCGGSGGASSYDEGETIKIGLQADISGDLAWPQPPNGVQMAVDDINASGGLLGKQVELIVADTQSDTQRYTEMAKKLIMQDEVCMMFGSGTSSAREAIRPLFEENQVLYNYMTNYEGGVASNYVICTGTIPAHNIQPLMENAAQNIGKKCYIVAADYNYGHISSDWVKKYAEDYGVTIVGEEYVPLTVSQFSTTINNIQKAQPDFVFVMAIGAAQRSFFDQWAAVNPGIPLVSSSNFGGTYEHKLIAAPALANSYFCSQFNEEMEGDAIQAFVKKWREKYPEEQYVNGDGYGAYYSVMLWAEAVKKAGSCDPAKVLEAYGEGVSVDTPTGLMSVDPKTHQLVCDMYLMRIDENHDAKVVKKYDQVLDAYLGTEKGVDLTTQERTDFFEVGNDS